MPEAATLDHEYLVVGAGFSGIGTGIALDKQGLSDYVIVDEAEEFGGTWQWNRYPGIAVDIPSFSYQFSFEKSPDWSRVYAPGKELREYAVRVAENHGLRPRTRFKTRISNATFLPEEHAWRVETSAGDELRVRHIIDATGVLNQPKFPEIEGVMDFGGTTLHTSRWDPEVELKGKRVAVIGTGASAIQLIPSIAPEVGKLTVFQRTPIWCMPKFDAPMPKPVHWVLGRVPGGARALRLLSQTFVELTFPLAAHYHRPFGLASIFEKQARRYIRQEVDDPDLQEKLTPQYGMGCKRPSFHNTYLRTYNRENVELETTPITKITENAVVCADGTEHEIDVLILATGFKVFDSGNFPKYPVSGREGTDLERWWDENRYQAYHGVSVPGFPNFFTVFGPYGYNGSSYFNLVETQSHHIVRALKSARGRGATLVEVKPEANAKYFQKMLGNRDRQVFWQESCAVSNSYYFDRHGDVPLRPQMTIGTMWDSRTFPLDDYRYESLGAREPAGEPEAVAA